MVDLGTLGGPEAEANAINNSGQVVGHSGTAAGVVDAFFWSPSTGMLALGPSGVRSRSANGINDVGEISCNYTDSFFEHHAGREHVLAAAAGHVGDVDGDGQRGTAPYQYRFWVQPWNGAWTVLRDWSPTPTFVWQPTASGGYNVSVEARSAGGTAVEVQSAELFMIAAP